MNKIFFFLIVSISLLLVSLFVYAQNEFRIERVEPPFWWAGMEYNEIQLVVYGKNLSDAEVSIDSEAIIIRNIH
ncbi:hypothetical protein ES708_02503 [subsurface metagenome]